MYIPTVQKGSLFSTPSLEFREWTCAHGEEGRVEQEIGTDICVPHYVKQTASGSQLRAQGAQLGSLRGTGGGAQQQTGSK